MIQCAIPRGRGCLAAFLFVNPHSIQSEDHNRDGVIISIDYEDFSSPFSLYIGLVSIDGRYIRIP